MEFSIDQTALKKLTLLSTNEGHLESLFNAFDFNGYGTINTLDLLCGISALCKGTIDEKLDTIFNAFDCKSTFHISIFSIF